MYVKNFVKAIKSSLHPSQIGHAGGGTIYRERALHLNVREAALSGNVWPLCCARDGPALQGRAASLPAPCTKGSPAMAPHLTLQLRSWVHEPAWSGPAARGGWPWVCFLWHSAMAGEVLSCNALHESKLDDCLPDYTQLNLKLFVILIYSSFNLMGSFPV